MNMSDDVFFSDLLKRFRKRRKLTQQQLADQIGVSRKTVGLWEQGTFKPDIEALLYEIVKGLGLSVQEQQQLFEAYTITALNTSFHNPPLKRNLYFTGRNFQLNQLHTLLMAGKQVALTQAISGLGGIGKTQLALEYAYRYQKSYHDIFWASADTEEALMAAYMRFAEVLHLPEAKEADQNKVKEAVRRWFRVHTNWLLIIDNIDELHLLPSFVPENRQGAVLLTTRRQVTEPVAQALELEVLPEEDAILFLLKRAKVLALDASLEEASRDELEAAREITSLLGNLPLALDQAGAYILETKCSFAEYRTLFQTSRKRLLQRRIGESIPTDHPASVTTTFRLNFQQVQQRSDPTADLLRLLAFLAPDTIPEEILTADASQLGPTLAPVAADIFLLNQAIELLRAYSLVLRDPKEKSLSVHRLVQAVLQDTLEEEERRTWRERAMLAVNTAFPHVEHQVWSQCERMLSQALFVAQSIEQDQLRGEEAGRLFYETAVYLWERARYGEAEPLYQRVLRIREQQLGPEHTSVAYPLNALANLYSYQGKYAQAESLYQRALRIWEQQLGPGHPLVATSFNNLADLYSKQGKYEEAEPLWKRALHIWEQQLGPEHDFVATSLNNLAELYREQGKYAQAEPLYQRALSIWEQQLGPEHPDVAYALNNLAALYTQQGKYEEAEPLYQRALQIREQSLGPEHPQVAYSLNGLADLYREQGKHGEAERLYQRALHIYEQQLGPEYAYVAYSLHGLANLYREQSQYAQAEPLYQRALSIWEQQLGEVHPETARIIHDLARFWEMQGNSEEARAWYVRALTAREWALGKHHPKTTETRARLIALLRTIGQHEEATHLEVDQLEIVQSKQMTNKEEQKAHTED